MKIFPKTEYFFIYTIQDLNELRGSGSNDDQINIFLRILQHIGISEDNFSNLIEKTKQLYKEFKG